LTFSQSFSFLSQKEVFMLESKYQKDLIDTIGEILPGCFIIKIGTDFMQGLPDLLILWRDRWAMLEVKPRESAREQPNQRYYVDLFGEMSFAAFIYPENEEEVLDALQHAFRSRRKARVS
jgi:hypothetical protein